MSMRKLCLVAVILATACASAPIKKADVAALAEADALVLQGCYDCLVEARDTYARVGVGKARPLVVARLFETDLLIGLRQKELALDPSAAFTEAHSLARELPVTVEAERYLTLAEAVPGDDVGWTHRETGDFRRAHLALVSKIDGELEWLGTGALSQPVRSYLALALDCAYPTRRNPSGEPPRATARRTPLPDAPPLLVYRAGICIDISGDLLKKVRDAVPRFVEAGYFLSRTALVTVKRDGAGRARDWLAEVYKRFPASPSVTYLNGNYQQLIGDCKAALVFYDDTIVLRPAHETALLGRTICLTYLKRTDDAIAEATHMIGLKIDNTDQAYYWRAWNHYSRRALDLARADSDIAKRMRNSTEVLTLAGMIEHDQDDLNPAEADLRGARTMFGGDQNCTAMWYLGLVMIKREQWMESGRQFEDAMGCYETGVKESEAGLRSMQAREDVDPDFKARQIAGFEAALKEDRTQQYAAAFNAANQYAHGGDVPKAKILLEIAARDPALATQVADLRKIIGGG
jgi:tetratricopeptide (TPR) repeat protein